MGDFGEDSDESDDEGGLGNVNRLIMRPPGHSGKAKRGHLCFDAAFETGNLGRVDLVNEFEYDLYIRPDTCSPKSRFWFHFTVDNVRLHQRVIFNIVNISKGRNLFSDGMRPIVRSTTRPKWYRIPKRYVFYQKSPLHHFHYVLSMAFFFDREDEMFHFALTYPYGYNRCQAFLGQLEARIGGLQLEDSFTRECLSTTIQKRRLDVLQIGNKTTLTHPGSRRVVVVLARAHPGESSASYICQGLIEMLISSHSIATHLRANVLFILVPMLNADGVFLGNFRSTAVGADLNRVWHRTSPFTHPTITALVEFLRALDKSKDYQIDFVLDIHVNTTFLGSFMYGNSYDDVYRNERHTLFPKLLANVADDFERKNCLYNACPSKAGTARRFFTSSKEFNEKLNAYSYEVSMFGYRLRSSDQIIPYTEDGYKRCGRNLLKAFLHYFRLMEVIPMDIVKNVKTKRRRNAYRERPCNISSSRSNHTTRIVAPVHCKDICISYNAEDQKMAVKGKKSTSPPKISPNVTVISRREPCLSIIDFNVITEKELS